MSPNYPASKSSMSQTGHLSVPEGQIFWSLSVASPASGGQRSPADTHSKPLLLFIHAAVADHTLWGEQVAHLTSKGWPTLRYDIFGFGESSPSEPYLASDPRPPVDHVAHAATVVKEVWHAHSDRKGGKVVVVGLSMGGGLAVAFAVAHPELCAGIVVVAGGLFGFEAPNKPEEDAMCQKMEDLTGVGDAEALALLYVRYWGDGPLQAEGRLTGTARERLFGWCKDIAVRECRKTGGFALPAKVGEKPPAVERLDQIRVPVAVGIGRLDETAVISAMEFLGKNILQSEVKYFDTAHMVNLEVPGEFNDWLNGWLEKNVLGST